MKKIDEKEFIWVEKYRPQCIDDLIITDKIREQLKSWIHTDGQIPNLGFFSNQPGTGKSSFSRAILNDLDADGIFINASKDGGIDTIRSRLYDFASSVSFTGQPKVVVLDELDGTSNSFQEAFRGQIEEFSKNCRFIATGNFINKVSKAVLDRFMKFDFDTMYSKSQKELIKQIYDRCCFILDNEGVEYNKDELKPMILNMYPGVREIIMNLQESVALEQGKKVLRLESNIMESNTIYKKLLNAIKLKDTNKFTPLAREIHNHDGLFKYVYKNIDKLFEEESIGQVIITTHHFMNSNVLIRDPEITIVAYCFQLARAADIKFK